jgi:hypothetical protein
MIKKEKIKKVKKLKNKMKKEEIKKVNMEITNQTHRKMNLHLLLIVRKNY